MRAQGTEREDLLPVPADVLNEKTLAKRLAAMSTMAWAYTILSRLNLTRHKANTMFAPNEYPSGKTSSKFNQYIEGVHAPQRPTPESKAYDIVREAEAVMKSSEATEWLNHPLWRIFARDVGNDELASYLSSSDADRDEEGASSNLNAKRPFRARGAALFAQYPPADLHSLEGTENDLRIESFDDFVHLCAMFRLGVKQGYWLGHWQLIYLSEQASEMNDVFRFIRAPFIKMLETYYGKPEWLDREVGEEG